MGSGFRYLSSEQRQSAVKRLTALWAFTESGLGGVMHAFQVPFTGLLVGGMAVIMICLVAELSEGNYKIILKSAVVVLIVKAMVSPHTPPPAYIAVSFQALLGFGLFSLLRVNFFSILLLGCIAMIESAIQKLLVLTLFLGQSLWKALDEMLSMLARQFGSSIVNGSYWVIGIYLFIYFIGGILIAVIAWRTINGFKTSHSILQVKLNNEAIDSSLPRQKRKPVTARIFLLLLLMLVLSAILFVFAADIKTGFLAVVRTISWTLSAILLWYLVIGPLFTKAVQKLLLKKQSRYAAEVSGALAFLPVLKQLSVLAWKQSSTQPGYKRGYVFLLGLIYAVLTYTETPATVSK